MSYPLDTSVRGPLKKLSGAIKRLSPPIFNLKAFVCGMPLGQGNIAMESDKERVFAALLRRIEQLAKKKRANVVAFKDFDHSYAGVLDGLQRFGYSKFDALPNTEMNIWFSDFEEYLTTLSAANRYDLRRKFRKSEKLPALRMEVTDSLDDTALDDRYRLYRQTEAVHDMGLEILPRDFFRRLPVNMPGEIKFFLWRLDGRLVAFILSMVCEKRFMDYYVGLDYDVAHKYHLYFLKFRACLKWCIDNKIKTYEMGITGYEPKRRLGFDLVPLYLYVKHRNAFVRPLFKTMCRFLKFENFDPDLRKIRQRKGRAWQAA